MHLSVQPWSQIEMPAKAIRRQVFIIEQAVPEELDLDGLDDQAWHVLIQNEEQPIATARLLLEPDNLHLGKNVGRIGRMAVLEQFRRQGHGQELLKALIKKGNELGVYEFYLHAQLSAKTLYEKFGFMAEGEVFDEAGIAHQTMRLKK
jgi:predicted GNAT family N-acyltransferase